MKSVYNEVFSRPDHNVEMAINLTTNYSQVYFKVRQYMMLAHVSAVRGVLTPELMFVDNVYSKDLIRVHYY